MASHIYNVRPVPRTVKDPFAPSVYPDRSGGPEQAAAEAPKPEAADGNMLPDPGASAFTAKPEVTHKPWTETQSGAGTDGLNGAYADLYGKLKEYGVTSIPALDEFVKMMDAFLRPQTESAIASRRASAEAGMAEMDADAYSRGMGASSYLSSVKSRERASSEADISELEKKYSSSMAEYLYKAVGSMREMESDIAKTRMKLAAEKEEAERKREYEAASAREKREYETAKEKEKREYEAAKEKEKRDYEAAKEKEKRDYETAKAKAANDAKLKLAREKAKADRETKLAVAEKKAAAAEKLQKQKEKQAVKVQKLKAAASEAAAKIRNSGKTSAKATSKTSSKSTSKSGSKSASGTSAKKAGNAGPNTAETGEVKYGHNKNGAYFDGKWYDGDWSYLKRGHTYKEYSNYLKGLTKSERYLFFTSSSREWRIRRWQVQYELPQADYNDLYAAYMPKGAAGTGSTSKIAKTGGAKKGGGAWKRVVS